MDFTAICVCCHQDKNLKDLWSENGKRGSYGRMLIECFGLSEASKICLECVSRMQKDTRFNESSREPCVEAAALPIEMSTEIIVKVEPWSYEDDNDPQEADTGENEMLNKDNCGTVNHGCNEKEQEVTAKGESGNIVIQTVTANDIVEETVTVIEKVNEEFDDITKVNRKKDLCANKLDTKDDERQQNKLQEIGHKQRRRRSKHTEEELRQVLDAVIQKKMTSKEAEEKLHCTRQTLRRWLEDIGFKRPKYVPKYTAAELSEVVQQVVQLKMSCNQALAKLQCSRRVLKKEFQKIGFKPTASAFTPYSTEHLKEVLAAVSDDRMTFSAALESLQCSRQTLKRRLDEYIATGDVNRHVTPAPRLKSREMDDNMKKILDDVANKRIPIERAKVLLGCGQETLKKKLQELYGFYKPPKTPSRNDVFIEELQSVLRHTNATPFKMTPGKLCACAYCPYPAKGFRGDADKLKRHVWTEHADARVDGVARIIMIERIQVIKLDVADLKCTVCDIKLTWTDMLPHLETVHSLILKETKLRVIPFNLTTKQLINCALCPQSFTSLNLVNHHMNTHYTEHTCKQCNTTFMSAILLKTHERRIHLILKQYCCETCGKEFKHRNNLVKHNYNTHGRGRFKRTAGYKCTECGQKFHANEKLRQHIIEEHENTTKYTCDLCPPDKSFVKRSSYLKHYKLLHKGLKYECKLCDKKFQLPCLLRDHEDSHSDHEDYVCKTCGAKFVSKAFAKLHRRTHTEVVRFECQFCETKFKSKSGLNKHLMTKHQELQEQVEVDKGKNGGELRIKPADSDENASKAIKRKFADSAPTSRVTKRKITDSVPTYKVTKRKHVDSAEAPKTTKQNVVEYTPTSKSKRKPQRQNPTLQSSK